MGLIALIYSLLVFLFPVALYCLALSYLNRGRRPVLVSGTWDAVGLLFALSGFLLLTGPVLLDVVIGRCIDYLPGAGDPATLSFTVGAIRTTYFLAVAVGATLLITGRGRQTAVYNVETERFRAGLHVALAELGLDALEHAGRLIIAPAEHFDGAPAGAVSAAPLPPRGKTLNVPPGGPRYAELTVDAFPAFCHATLHWQRASPALRLEIEQQLPHALESAVAVDNPAAGWFLGFSGLAFLLITLLAIFFVAFVVWRR